MYIIHVFNLPWWFQEWEIMTGRGCPIPPPYKITNRFFKFNRIDFILIFV